MDLNIKLEHEDAPRCFAVNVDPEGCTCRPDVWVQIGGKARGWVSLGPVLPLAWTRDDYNRIVKSWVDEHQRPTTATENKAVVLEKIRRDGSRRLSSCCSSVRVAPATNEGLPVR